MPRVYVRAIREPCSGWVLRSRSGLESARTVDKIVRFLSR